MLNAAGPIVSDPWGRDQLGAEVRGIRLVCTRTRACNGESVLSDIARLAARLRERPVSFTLRVGADRVRARLDEAALAQVVFASGKSRIESRIGAGVLRKESDKSRYPEESSPTTVASCARARRGSQQTRWTHPRSRRALGVEHGPEYLARPQFLPQVVEQCACLLHEVEPGWRLVEGGTPPTGDHLSVGLAREAVVGRLGIIYDDRWHSSLLDACASGG